MVRPSELLWAVDADMQLGKAFRAEESPTIIDTWKEMEKIYAEGWFITCIQAAQYSLALSHRQGQGDWGLKLQHQDTRNSFERGHCHSCDQSGS
jgi:hypothetical protein